VPNRIAELLPTPGADFARVLAIVTRLDRAGWTSVTVRHGPGAFEPLTLLAGLAAQCPWIGLVAELDPAELPPYSAARRLAALDHLSGGRSGWQLAEHVAVALGADYASAMISLWDGWDDGAHVIDRSSGQYIDISKVHRSDYAGTHFKVAGPLDIPTPLQRHPVRYGAHPGPGIEVVVRADAHLRVVSLPIELALWDEVLSDGEIPLAHGTCATLRQRLHLPRPAPSRPHGASA
jgi:alkanesulfonate monooxygenase SsuD/methylene tetrahydromethanopterin reductase-like flavin-dependent oxidoreductase (luciferase family)